MKPDQKKYIRNSFILLCIIMNACNNNKTGDGGDKIAQEDTSAVTAPQLVFDKLVGVWQNDEGKSFEKWTKNANGSYKSVVFTINGNDTTYTEEITVFLENGKWISENKVAGQNEGKPARFVESIRTDSSVQFSNPVHDFPTDVNYTVRDANTVIAFIVGPNKNGGKDTIPFSYKRLK